MVVIKANDIINRLKSENKVFLTNDKNGKKIGNKNYKLIKRKNPILISAPHLVRTFREGKSKNSDFLTAPLAIYISEMCNCNCLVRTYNDNDDPNFPIGRTIDKVDNEYLLFLKKFVIENPQYLLIDLHGCSNDKNFDCSIWTDNFKTCNEEIVEIFENNFKDINMIIDYNYFSGGQVNRQVSLTGTNVFQLEVIRKYRSTKIENQIYVLNFIKAMIKSINFISENLEKQKVKKNIW